jgi:hypothetical protein
LLFFLGGQLALLVCMECWWPGLRDPEFGQKLAYLEARLEEQPDRPLLLMFGSSRTLQGFQADRLNGLALGGDQRLLAFNFGLTGAGPLKVWPCLRQILDRGVRPAMILVEILPPLLNEPGPERTSEENWLRPPRLAGADVLLLRRYHSRPAWLCRTWARSVMCPCYTHRDLIRSCLSSASLLPSLSSSILAPMDRFGWQPLGRASLPAETQSRLTDQVKQQYSAAFRDYRIGAGAYSALCDLLTRCKTERIPAALVLMPEGTAFRRCYSAEMEGALQAFLGVLQDGYGAALIDARSWVGDSGFYDSHHLLPGGATAFSDRLATVVAQLAMNGGLRAGQGQQHALTFRILGGEDRTDASVVDCCAGQTAQQRADNRHPEGVAVKARVAEARYQSE